MPDTPDLIMELNDFANHCGYFFNACMQDGIIYFDELSGEYFSAVDYIVVSDEDTIRRLREAGITGLAVSTN